MENATIGIAGGIGAGKSVVSRVLRCNGFPVYDCDSEAKKLMVTNLEIRNSLKEKLGNDIYFPDGTLNRKNLAGKLFSNPDVRAFVNSVVHTAVIKDIKETRRHIQGLFFIESAILASSKLDRECDRIWLVEAPINERIRRVGIRDSIDSKEILKRIESQKEEISQLKSDKLVIMENNNHYPLLPLILRLTDKITNNQNYTVLC